MDALRPDAARRAGGRARTPRAAAALLVAAAATFAATTRADDPARAGAERDATLHVRFAEAQVLETAGRWADALTRLEQIAAERPTPQIAFHVGLCLDHLGRLLLASRTYRGARDAARGIAPDVVAEADERLRDLDARLPRVQVSVVGEVRDVVVAVDGIPLAGSIIALDPGPHVAVALRDGATVAAAAFSAEEGKTKGLSLRVLLAPAPKR